MQARSPSHALMRQWKSIQGNASTEKQHTENTKLIRQYEQMNDFQNHVLNK